MPETTLAMPWRVVVCTWFGAGRLRPAPGTWGSLAAGLLALPLLACCPTDIARWILVGGVFLTTVLGVACSSAASLHFGCEDPPQVVIDEVAGSWLALAILPAHVLSQPILAVLVAVALFRVFDIAKPWPVGWCEHLPRGWGIMADDLAAGAMAGCLATALVG